MLQQHLLILICTTALIFSHERCTFSKLLVRMSKLITLVTLVNLSKLKLYKISVHTTIVSKHMIIAIWLEHLVLSPNIVFYGLRSQAMEVSIGVMFFILYKLYVLLPHIYLGYLALTGDCAFLASPPPPLPKKQKKKTNICFISKCFELWGHWKCPHKSPSPCNICHTHVIIQMCVLINHINMPTHTCFEHCGFHVRTIA